ncbi:2-oxo-4-hydroxy-4-carboxy-5-ureidoimidazoline decarboxylase [Streptomyces sp. ZYX-F-203]
MDRFNGAPREDAVRLLLACLPSPHWAGRIATHRPYPDLAALLAAADEAVYDLAPPDLTAALAAEPRPTLPKNAYAAARTALGAAHTAYESRFGHAFVICLHGLLPTETADHLLEGIRSRLANDPDDERLVATEELRRITRSRLALAFLESGP